MKFVKKFPEMNADIDHKLLNNQWTPIKEPKKFIYSLLLSVPFMILNAFISIKIIRLFTSISLSEFGITSDGLSITINLSLIFGFVFLLFFHEFIHLMFIPNFMKSKKTYVGLSIFGGFVITEEEILKPRYILITIAPFVIISILLPIFLGVFGGLTTVIKFLIIINAMASSVDMLTLILVLSQLPKQATLVSNGPKTYWNIK